MVELIVVIVVLSLVAAVVITRFTSPSGFNPSTARDAAITVAREAQQMALGRNNVTFNIGQSGGDWVFIAASGGTTVRSVAVPSTNVVLETGSTSASSDTCATGFDDPVASDFEVAFDLKGNATTLTNNSNTETVANGVRICVNDDNSLSVCISPGGFAYAGACDD